MPWLAQVRGDAMQQATRRWGSGWSGGLTARAQELVCPVHFAFQIRNYHHIKQAWGDHTAEEVSGIVASRILGDLVDGGGSIHVGPDGHLNLDTSSLHVPGVGALSTRCRACVDAFCAVILLEPITTSVGPLCLWLSGSWEFGADAASAPAGRGVTALHFVGEPVLEDPAWGERYRRNMAVAAGALGGWFGSSPTEVAADWLALRWQPVRDGRSEASLLYYEALPAFVSADGGVRSARAALAALEHLGFARVLDHKIVSCVVEELELNPDVVLGVNISAQSAICDDWWDEIEGRLRFDPGMARRLVIEITETARMHDISAAVRFVTRMRRLGVCIALDNFGTGYASIRHLLALSPDIVKVDRFFLRQAVADAKGTAMFTQVVRLAATFGATTIAVGVEDEVQADFAREAGADWQQGLFWGAAAGTRPWVLASRNAANAQERTVAEQPLCQLTERGRA